MDGFKKILVALDGSESGYHALGEAFKLSESLKCWITAHCVTPPYRGDLEFVGVGDAMSAMDKRCSQALEKARGLAETARVPIKTTADSGEIHECIANAAEDEGCFLIVVGRKGRQRVERSLVGSSAARVIGFSRRDVMVVPLESTVKWNRMLVATDGSPNGRSAVEKASYYASHLNGELSIVSVVEMPAELTAEAPNMVDKLIEKAKDTVSEACMHAESLGVKAEGIVRDGESAPEIILDLAKSLGSQLIVLGSHGKTALARLLMGSVAEKVIGLSETPVLVTKI